MLVVFVFAGLIFRSDFQAHFLSYQCSAEINNGFVLKSLIVAVGTNKPVQIIYFIQSSLNILYFKIISYLT